MSSCFVNGEPASRDDLIHQAVVGYGAYTSFRVEDGAARGLDRHLERLRRSGHALFGQAPDEARLRAWMRRAVEGRDACWLRVSLFAPEIGPRSPSWTGRPRVMTLVSDPPAPLAASMRLMTLEHQRAAPELKTVGAFDLIRARRAARAGGFDDALFVGPDGGVSEGSLWNIGFVRGETVVWPQAPLLAGVTQAILAEGLARAGVAQRTTPVARGDLGAFDGAFVCNSATPACPVAAIDDRPYVEPQALIGRLRDLWAAAPPQAL